MSIEGLRQALENYASAEASLQNAEHSLITTRCMVDRDIRLMHASATLKKPTESALETQVALHESVLDAETRARNARIALIRAKNAVEVARELQRMERLHLQREIAAMGAKGEE